MNFDFTSVCKWGWLAVRARDLYEVSAAGDTRAVLFISLDSLHKSSNYFVLTIISANFISSPALSWS